MAIEPEAASSRKPRFWVNTVSLDHVEDGIAAGITQADHGADTRLRRLAVGDGIVFYSPRTALHGGTPLQQFTAHAVVTGAEPYRVAMSDDFHPWRLAVRFIVGGRADARPLVERLSFIPDPTHWGYPFRRGLFEIPEADFCTIVEAMIGQTPPLVVSS